ncbi:MAG: hypothetical protein ACXVBE_08235, partial [Bdellovibrionota bacterium]
MKRIIYALILSLVMAPAIAPTAAYADRESAIARKERQKRELEKEKKELASDAKEAAKDLSQAEKDLKEIEASKPKAEGPKGHYTPKYKDELRDWEKKYGDAKEQRDAAKSRLKEAKDTREDYDDKIGDIDEQIGRLENTPEKKSDDCPDGNCPGKKGAPNQPQQSNWDGFANVLKAATPLGLGAMGLYGAVKTMNTQSSDYRYYNANNTALGLPSSPPQGYGGLIGAALGPAALSS